MATKKQSLTVPAADKAKQDCRCGCTPCEGTCCTLDCLVQPRFFCGQLLTDGDLSALLKWSRDRFGLSRYRHGWGVVCGLDVRAKFGSPMTIVVTPGYAVDCCGNDIIICQDAELDIKGVYRDEEDPCADLRRQIGIGGEMSQQFGNRLRAVDIYLQYDQESADPTTAMGRGSCKQVTECEYSRTKETHKLTPKLAVVGTDPVLARATKWHEEYEKCLDVLKTFRSQFPQSRPPEDVRRWLLRRLDEHPEYGLRSMRQQLDAESASFFESERNLVVVLFALVQVCRNAFLNCECFGCDEDTQLPLARVWVSPEDRDRNKECHIVAVDAYPPYRRPIQPECWPAPLGALNVGRFIWHRWPEVCAAASGLGLNIERTPFTLPGTLGALQEALSCDLFVGCDERRFAYVLDADAVPEFNLGIFGQRVVGFCKTRPDVPAPPQEPVQCPNITIDNPQAVFTGQPITFAALVNPPVDNLTYKWTVPDGTDITSGQGTSRIEVETFRKVGLVTATVLIEGLDPRCPREARASTEVRPKQEPQPLEQSAKEKSPPVEDDFTQLSGIKEARAGILQNAGIRTFADLAKKSVEELKQIFPNVTEDVLKEWIQEAQKRAG